MNLETKVCLNCSDVTTSLAAGSAMDEAAAPVPAAPLAKVRQIRCREPARASAALPFIHP